MSAHFVSVRDIFNQLKSTLSEDQTTIIQLCMELQLQNKEIVIQKKETEIQTREKVIQEKETEKKEQELQIQKLQTEFANINLEFLILKGSLTVSGVMVHFEDKFLKRANNSRREKYQNFVETSNVLPKLQAWDLDQKSFVEAAVALYSRKSEEKAQPKYLEENSLTIPEKALFERDWKVLGVIWQLIPLPAGALKKRNSNGDTIDITELKNIYE
ncbi:unnamed protein product [Tenebrio molitor]|nr:unnamed protein product [Tenebrio molitor]